MRAVLAFAAALAGCGERQAAVHEPGAAPRTASMSPNAMTSSALPAASSSAAAPPVMPPPATLPGPASLVGEWRLAAIDGAPLDATFGVAVSIDRRRISFEPRCAGFVWDYRYQDGVLTTARAAGFGPTRQSDGSQVVCAVAVAPEQRQLAQALDRATRVERTPSNGVVLSGGGRSVTLYSQ